MDNSLLNGKQLTIGQKAERIRLFKGFKQEYLAKQLGISQSQFSKIKRQQEIEDVLLEQIAEILGVSTESIRKFDDDMITSKINNSRFEDMNEDIPNSSRLILINFNPFERINELYERLLQSEREKNEILKRKSDSFKT